MNQQRLQAEEARPARALVAVAHGAIFLLGVVTLLMGALLPRLPIGPIAAGQLGAFAPAGVLVGSIFVGPILDRLGAKPVLLAALVLVAGPMAIIGRLQALAALGLAAFLYGLGGGILNVTGNALIADLYPVGKERAMNILGVSFAVGALTAPILLSSLLGGKTPAQVLPPVAAIVALLAVPVALLHFPVPQQAGRSLGAMLRVLRRAPVWLFAWMLFFETANENVLFVWGGKLISLVLGLGAARAMTGLIAVIVGLGAGRALGAWALSRVGSRGTLWYSCGLLLAGAGLGWSSSSLAALTMAIFILGAGMGAIYPTILGLAAQAFPGETGTVYSAIMGWGMVGGTLGPWLAGWLAHRQPRDLLAVTLLDLVVVAVLTLPAGRFDRSIG